MPAPTRSVRRPYPGVVARLSGLAGIGLLVSLVCALVITFSLTNPPESYAQPALPHQFVGTAKINGTTAPDGTVVTATIDGVEAATAIVTGGFYALKIHSDRGLPDPIGKTIKFTVGGQIANESQLFQAGAGTELNLTVTPVPPDVGSKDWFPNWSPFLSQTPPSPGNGPKLSGVAPNTAYPRQLVSLKGETAGTRVVWDVGRSREADVSPVAPITKDYFQIPAGASPGVHKVAIRNSSGTSNAVEVTVLAASGDFPAPRIEDVGLRLQPSGKWILLLTAANLDADATVTVDSTQADSALISGLPISYMKDHTPDTFKYPVYHYSQLAIVAPDLPAGATLTLVTTNADGESDGFSYRLPADWKDVDSDGDGLLDRWEEGTYTAPSGTTIDLATMGVHKHKKDILIEADWVKVAAPPEVVWTKLEEAFANAPILNPDGTSGVNIIVDRGQGGAFVGGGDLLTPDHQSMSYSSRYSDYRSAWYPGPSTPAPASDGAKIAFTSERHGNREIYVMNADGSNQTRLTHNSATDWRPSWSPDGTQIAFESDQDGNREIYVMNADRSNQTRLTDNSAMDSRPRWSPDGAKIAFESDQGGNREIYVMNADGSNQTRLTDNAAIDSRPRWSPDGAKIAFEADRDGNREIYVMNADGSNQTRLTVNPAMDSRPRWSPDGAKIAFESHRDGNLEIYVMNADGSNQTRLTDNADDDWRPSWSPDGAKITFISVRDGNREIYVMNSDGTDQKRLTDDPNGDLDPSWGPAPAPAPAPAPTGAKIAFASTINENSYIYVMNTDGSGRTRLSEWQANDTHPDWSSDGNKIVFTSDSGGTIQNPGGDQEIWVMNAAGSDVVRITDNVGDDYRPKWSPDGTQIAFESQRDGNREIYVMNADGSGQTNLTNDPAWHGSPSWSPDGTKIAFTSDERVRIGIGNHDIYVMNADGSGQTRLTDNNEYDWSPSWSPDGTMIAFQRDHDIHVMNADGSGQTRLTDNPARDWQPSWSPDGKKIIFRSGRDGNDEIYVMNADGSGQTRLTNNPEADNDFPSWRPAAAPAPNGTKIAFSSQLNAWEQKSEIYVMNADGSGLTRLTDNLSNDLNPSWSADGTKVAFSASRDGNDEIYVMDADGSNQTRLTDDPKSDSYPSWSPDGTKIAFSSNRDGNGEIYVMNADGSKQTRLTDDAGLDRAPSWSPDGTKIAFSSSDPDGTGRDGEIHVMNADGSNQTRLTNNSTADLSPSWSPDGTKIVFASDRDGNLEIYVMNADGSKQTRLTDDAELDWKPSWSPDGNGITFMSSRDSRAFRPIWAIYVMNADGSGQTRLTYCQAAPCVLRNAKDSSWGPAPAPAPAPAPTGTKIIFDHTHSGEVDIGVMNADGTGDVVYLTNSGKDRLPAVSPDGKKIAFTSRRNGPAHIFVMDADGASPTMLTSSSSGGSHPTWSPDGTRIAFTSSGKIYVMDADGRNQKALTNLSSNADYFPAWSPDGKKIAFASNWDRKWGVHVINADGSGRTTLSDKDDAFPGWSPDSSKLVFISLRDGNFGLYEMNADGSGQKRLLSDESDKWMPSYSPDGKKIAFAKNIGRGFANGGGNYDIHTINADGTGLTRVTDNSIQGGYVTFATHKKRHFNVDRLGIFKYLVLARQSPDALGIAEFPFGGPTKGDDFWVALATWTNDPSRIASVTMHELGHDLGLAHGGIWPNPNHNTSKPNFPSIMSYRYAADGISTDCNNTPDGLLTFSQGQLKDIVEPDTDENIGICDNQPLDMNNDGSITSGGIDSDGRDGVLGTHKDYDQWGNMVIDFMNR